MVKVAVVGAGIIGLSSAVCIQRNCPDLEITLITEKTSPHTTSDIAAGVWLPYLLGETPEESIYRWGKTTFEYLHQLWKMEDGGCSKGVSMLPVFAVSSEGPMKDPIWKDVVFGFRKLNEEDLKVLHMPDQKFGFEFVGFTCEGSKLLPSYLDDFKSLGGQVEMRKVKNIKELSQEFDIVVNCTGIESYSLVPDSSVQPKRGQVARVIAPCLKHVILCEDSDGNYIIPNQETVVLGGTHQEGDWNTEIYKKDSEFIMTGCRQFIPSLKHAQVYKEVVGLRPGRPKVRLEMEKIGVSSNGEIPFTIIHNYGHGGSGLTLFWGCALQTAALVKEAITALQSIDNDREQFYYAPKSKL